MRGIVLLPVDDTLTRHMCVPRIDSNNLQKGLRQMYRSIARMAGVLLLSPLAAFGFDAVDTLFPSSSGHFSAYPADPIPPYELWTQFGMMYDTNILRRTTGDNSEVVSRASFGGRWDGRIAGRQGLHLAGRVDGYIYNKFSDLDNLGYSALGEWRWVLGNDLAGAMGASSRRWQASLSEIQRATHDPITENRLYANGRWAVGPHLGLRAGGDFIDYHRPSRAMSETKTVIGTAGIDWITDLGNMIGLETRQSRGNAPVNELVDPTGQFVNNDFHQTDVAVVATWLISPQLRFAGNAGRTRRTYSELPGRDFSGPTYRAALHWTPFTKAFLDFEATKHVSSIIDIGAAHVVVRSFAFGPGWAITAKTNVTARFINQHLNYGGDPAAALGAPQREEIVHTFRLGTYWEYTRHVHVTAAWENGERESNILGRNYRFNAYMANLRYIF